MRDEMAKVIVERPRLGGHGGRKSRAMCDIDPARVSIGMKRAASEAGDPKMLNENLAPLRRYIGRQVGRPWNKVWSEICANLRVTSTVQQHVRDHIRDFVAYEGVTRENGQVFVLWRRGPRPLDDSWFEFWVDPRTGILRRNKRMRNHRLKRKGRQAELSVELRKRMVERDTWTQFHLLGDGAWWEVSLEPAPSKVPFVDVVRGAGLSSLPLARLYDRPRVYAVDKRQLSKREIKRLKLPLWPNVQAEGSRA